MTNTPAERFGDTNPVSIINFYRVSSLYAVDEGGDFLYIFYYGLFKILQLETAPPHPIGTAGAFVLEHATRPAIWPRAIYNGVVFGGGLRFF